MRALKTLRWFFSIGARFARVVPGYTMAVVVLTLVSQAAMLLAFLLPLKVIMLLGSPGIPGYFPGVLSEFDREQLVLWLGFASILCYAVYLGAEKFIGYWSDCGARRLLKKSRKIVLFENQAEWAVSVYRRYARCVAGGVFASLTFITLGFIFPALALVVWGYCLGVCFLFTLYGAVNRSSGARLKENSANWPDIAGAVGFLFAFLFILVEFLYGSPPGLLVAIISLLLVRQSLSRLVSLVKDASALNKNRLKINALFFHGQALLEGGLHRNCQFWSLMEPQQRKTWIAGLLAGCGVKACRVEVRWRETGVAGVVAFDVQTFSGVNEPAACYLVKMFGTGRRGWALHEATLLASRLDGELPALRFLGAGQVEGYNCHVFEMPGAGKPSPREIGVARLFALTKLWLVTPPEDIVSRFQRSRPLLGRRIEELPGRRLLVAAGNKETVTDIERFTRDLGLISEILSAMPLFIYNPDISADTLIKPENGDFVVAHWGRWSLEPVGAGWPVRKKEWEALPGYFARAAEGRPALAGMSVDRVRLAALMFAFENFYRCQRYVSAIGLLPRILACVDSIKQNGVLGDGRRGGGQIGAGGNDGLERVPQ